MLILAIDTAATTAAAALTDGERLIAEFSMNRTLTHSETMLPMIKAMLGTAQVKTGDIDMFACAAGPGSFTGVRIGVSMVKGLAFGSSKPCVGVSTLEALAFNLDGFPPDAIICPVMDARRGQFYNALFRNGERLTPDRCISASELQTELECLGAPVYFTGDGCVLAHESIKLQTVRDTPERLRCSSGYSVAATALRRYNAEPDAVYTDSALSPIYLRPSQAERTHALG